MHRLSRMAEITRWLAWLAAGLSFSAVAGTPVELTPAEKQQILNSGTAFGQGALSVGAGVINGTGGAAGVPSYNSSPSGQAPGGVGLSSPASAKQTGCSGYTAPVGTGQTANQQDCDAVDFLTRHSNPKTTYSSTLNAIDPQAATQTGAAVLQSASDGAAFQPGGVAAGGASTTATGSDGVTATTTDTGCQPSATATPTPTTAATCYSYSTLVQKTCTTALTVTVTQPPSFAATQTYSCPAGGTLQGQICQPSLTAATVTYTCATGTLFGVDCIPPLTIADLWDNQCDVLQAAAL